MRLHYIFSIMGIIVACVGLSLLLPIGWSLYYRDGMCVRLSLIMAISILIGLGIFFIFRKKDKSPLTHREGMAIVGISWFFISATAAMPYIFCNDFPSLTDAFFESVSGISTTGATILSDIESLPKSILMWRSLTQWLGGMGIIVLTLAILPFLGVGGMQLYQAEVTGPFRDKLKPKIKDTAALLWEVYLLLTFAAALLFLFGGMNLFNALCHAFTTVSTGGFSTWNNSIAHYPSAYIQWIIIIFMFLGGTSFSLHYSFLCGDFKAYWKNDEFRFYTYIIVIASIVIAITLYKREYTSLEATIRASLFQVVSIITTTGFSTTNYDLWGVLAAGTLILLFFVGGCAGSTSGGIKCMRILLIFKYIYLEIYKLLHPRAVRHVKMGNTSVSMDVVSAISTFVLLYLLLFAFGSFVLMGDGIDMATAFQAVAASLGNVGPGLGKIGPVENFGFLPAFSKWLLCMCMLIGRLEIYTILLLFIPEFWHE